MTTATSKTTEASNTTPWPIAVDETTFPDELFCEYVLENISGKDGDPTTLTQEEADAVTKIDISKCTWATFDPENGNDLAFDGVTVYDDMVYEGGCITSLKGIEYFANLAELDVSDNQLEELDISHNKRLTKLNVNTNQLESLDVSHNTQLTDLDAGSNSLEKLDVSNNTQLTELDVYGNTLATLDVTHNTHLTALDAGSNQLKELDVSNNTQLTFLNVSDNQLAEIDLSNNEKLTDFNCDAGCKTVGGVMSK
ncbi:MAG: hypothetical protein Q4G29_03055 [Pseudoscardovia radai]|nr:hypothetical protein [Pseudoscardovia radai]